MKKFLFFLVALILMCFTLTCTSFADDTTLYTSVPNEHTIELVLSGSGNVAINGKTFTASTKFVLPRLSSVQISIRPTHDSFIQYAGYDSAMFSSQIYGGNFIIPSLNCNGVLTVYFGKAIVPGVKTGDDTPIALWLCVFVISAATSILLMEKIRRAQ